MSSAGPKTSVARLLTPVDVSEITGLSIETLAQWRSQRRGIQFIKLSRNRVAYRQADLDAWIQERIVPIQTEQASARRGA